MYCARWATKEEKARISIPVNLNIGVRKSGVPFMYDDENLYLLNNNNHTLVIGSTGSGKTQSIVLPMLKLSAEAEESVIVNDPKGEIYKTTSRLLEDKGYKVSVVDFDNPKYGNNFNPLTLPYELYVGENKDKAMELVENLGYYLLSDKNETSDPFWTNSTINFFTGLVLYLFDNASKEEINLVSVARLANEMLSKEKTKEFISKLDKFSPIYINVSGTLLSPEETKGSILSVFNQKIKPFISRESLTRMLLTTDFDFKELSGNKNALYIVGGTSSYSDSLIPLLIHQIYNAIDLYGSKDKTTNVILDEFDNLLPIKNFYKVMNSARSIYVRFTVIVKSYMDLINTYGKEDSEILKSCFQNIVYLISSDIKTLEEISKLCGNTYENGAEQPLINVEELKHLRPFEAIVLVAREMPIRTSLLPDYQIDWGCKFENKELQIRNNVDLKIFEF